MSQGLKHLNKESLYWLEQTDKDAFDAELETSRLERRAAKKKADAKAAAKARKRANRSREN